MNFTNVTSMAIDSYKIPSGIPTECYDTVNRAVVYNMECMIENICPHINYQIIRNGIIITLLYVLVIYTMNWYFSHGYRKYPTPAFDTYDKRLEFDFRIRNFFTILMLSYIAVVVYVNSTPIGKKNFVIMWVVLGVISILFKIYMRTLDKSVK